MNKLLILLTIPFILLQAQSSAPDDSLLNKLKTVKEDTSKVILLNNITWNYVNSDPARAIQYGKEALEIANSINYLPGKAQSLNNLGVVYSIWSDYVNGLKYFLQSLEIREKIGNKVNIAKTLNNIGIIYKNENNYDLALEYYFKSLKIKEGIGDSAGIANTYNNIGEVYQHENKYDDALKYHLKSLELEKKIGYKQGISTCLSNIAEIYKVCKKYDKALSYHLDALKIEKDIDNINGMIISYISISDIYRMENDYRQAIKNANMALMYSGKEGYEEGIYNSHDILSKIYLAKGDYKNAYFYRNLAFANRDSLFNEQKNQQIIEAQIKYGLKQKEEEISLLKKNSQIKQSKLKKEALINYILIGGIFLILLFAGYYYVSHNEIKRMNKSLVKQRDEISAKNKELEEVYNENKSLVAIVAHDLRSPLATIYNLADLVSQAGDINPEQKEYLEMISQITSSGTNLISDLLDLSNLEGNKHQPVFENIDVHRHILQIIRNYRREAEKKDIKIQYNCSTEGLMFKTDRDYLTRITVNLISNAIKFSPQGKNVYVDVNNDDKNLILIVKDEGPGIREEDRGKLFKKFQKLNTRPTANESSTGLGLAIVKLLTENLGGTVRVESELNKGSSFIVKLPS
jgi:signal transduction histidine kinase